ncbi:MAG: DUF2099 family protein [Candidatus Methanomethylophilaceae archaeon]|nr:DUF2099 family protein [Candidatus Methanomethylophilaceae archaeon]
MSRHVMEMLGRSTVTIEDGKVISITEPKVKVCPLFRDHRGIQEFNEDTIRENVEFRIKDFGMCNEDRQIRMGYFLSFGVSEILCLALKNKMINAAVIAADGCGTVVLDDPEIVQGMGGRISGIKETEPIPCVIEGIGAERVLDPKTAKIDQFDGVGKAFAMHYHKVAVTVTTGEAAQEIRDCFGRNVIIIAVHTTGTDDRGADMMFDFCDIITACASKSIREKAKTRAVLQAGKKVPVYAASEAGAELIKAKLDELGKQPDTELTESPEPLI